MQEKKRLQWIRVLSILAIVVSLYLVYQHYEKEDSEFCVFGEGFDCNIVNKSPYANVDGFLYFLVFDKLWDIPYIEIPIPNALISVLVFVFIFLTASSLMKKQPFFGMGRKGLISALKIIMYVSLIYAAYLLYIEAYILLNYCIFCLTLDVLIIIILWLVLGLQAKGQASKKTVRKRRKKK